MNVTTDTGPPPPYTTLAPIGKPPGSHDYLFVVGFFCTVCIIVTILYFTYTCKRSRSPPPPNTADYEGSNDISRLSRGLDDDVVVTFPTYVYSEIRKAKKVEAAMDADDSGCSICLEDYKPADVVRLFPECGHLFHVRCIDTWLKGHATCPVCRKFAGVKSTELTQ